MKVSRYSVIKQGQSSLMLSLPIKFGRIPSKKELPIHQLYHKKVYLFYIDSKLYISTEMLTKAEIEEDDVQEMSLTIIGKKRPGVIIPIEIRNRLPCNLEAKDCIFLTFKEKTNSLVIHFDLNKEKIREILDSIQNRSLDNVLKIFFMNYEYDENDEKIRKYIHDLIKLDQING